MFRSRNGWSSTAHLGPDKHVKDIDALDKYAEERWDTLLHYLVGSQTSAIVSQDLKDVILQAGLMRYDYGEEFCFKLLLVIEAQCKKMHGLSSENPQIIY